MEMLRVPSRLGQLLSVASGFDFCASLSRSCQPHDGWVKLLPGPSSRPYVPGETRRKEQ